MKPSTFWIQFFVIMTLLCGVFAIVEEEPVHVSPSIGSGSSVNEEEPSSSPSRSSSSSNNESPPPYEESESSPPPYRGTGSAPSAVYYGPKTYSAGMYNGHYWPGGYYGGGWYYPGYSSSADRVWPCIGSLLSAMYVLNLIM